MDPRRSSENKSSKRPDESSARVDASTSFNNHDLAQARQPNITVAGDMLESLETTAPPKCQNETPSTSVKSSPNEYVSGVVEGVAARTDSDATAVPQRPVDSNEPVSTQSDSKGESAKTIDSHDNDLYLDVLSSVIDLGGHSGSSSDSEETRTYACPVCSTIDKSESNTWYECDDPECTGPWYHDSCVSEWEKKMFGLNSKYTCSFCVFPTLTWNRTLDLRTVLSKTRRHG
jgi:hypothetical protein